MRIAAFDFIPIVYIGDSNKAEPQSYLVFILAALLVRSFGGHRHHVCLEAGVSLLVWDVFILLLTKVVNGGFNSR
jgi:hypothetical protein